MLRRISFVVPEATIANLEHQWQHKNMEFLQLAGPVVIVVVGTALLGPFTKCSRYNISKLCQGSKFIGRPAEISWSIICSIWFMSVRFKPSCHIKDDLRPAALVYVCNNCDITTLKGSRASGQSRSAVAHTNIEDLRMCRHRHCIWLLLLPSPQWHQFPPTLDSNSCRLHLFATSVSILPLAQRQRSLQLDRLHWPARRSVSTLKHGLKNVKNVVPTRNHGKVRHPHITRLHDITCITRLTSRATCRMGRLKVLPCMAELGDCWFKADSEGASLEGLKFLFHSQFCLKCSLLHQSNISHTVRITTLSTFRLWQCQVGSNPSNC